MLRFQAKIGGTGQYDALLRLANALNLPATQLWLAHNGPAGKQPASFARFPAPDWRPDGGWRVDPSLIYAHTLQESDLQFPSVVSSAGARGSCRYAPARAATWAFLPRIFMHEPVRWNWPALSGSVAPDISATGGLLPGDGRL